MKELAQVQVFCQAILSKLKQPRVGRRWCTVKVSLASLLALDLECSDVTNFYGMSVLRRRVTGWQEAKSGNYRERGRSSEQIFR